MKTLIQTGFNAFEIALAAQMADSTTEFFVDDYVHLSVRGGVWRVVKVEMGRGLSRDAYDEDMLTLEWICGCADPERLVRFSSGQARKLSDMEVIARCAR